MNVVEKFLKYVAFDTQSDGNSSTYPSTLKQKDLGAYLKEELISIGMENVSMDEYGYVYGFLPASEGLEEKDVLGFVAHMDTSPDVSGANVKPQIISYNGGDIALSDIAVISEEVFPFLEKYKGEDLIVTDGTTLLGADDKSGIAEIVAACEFLINNPEVKHGKIAVCFTPDEEVGGGTEYFDIEKFGAKYAYTVDGGALGEIEYENFNAASCFVKINGVNIHPGSAKNKMKNAVLLASKFISMLPEAETPAHTEAYEGFYHVAEIEGNESEATLSMIIRDHDMEKFINRKEFIVNLVSYLNGVYGEGTFEASLRDTYYNMKEKLLPYMFLIDNAKKAMEDAGVTPEISIIRGGTDGAMLSYKGLPCPNLSTGGENYHGIHEFIPVSALYKMTDVLINLMKA